MKINQGPITITEVPGLASIVIARDPDLNDGVCITLSREVMEQQHDLAGLGLLIEGLQEAQKQARLMVGLTTAGPWERIEDIPDSISEVYDRDGDRVRRDSRSSTGWEYEGRHAELYAPYRLTR